MDTSHRQIPVQINGESHTVVRSVHRELSKEQAKEFIGALVRDGIAIGAFSWPFSGRKIFLTTDVQGNVFKLDLSSPRAENIATKRIFVDRVVKLNETEIVDTTPRILEAPRGLRVKGVPKDEATRARLERSGMKFDEVGTMYLPVGTLLVYQTPDGELFESVKGTKGPVLVHLPDPNEPSPVTEDDEAEEAPGAAHALFRTVESFASQGKA